MTTERPAPPTRTVPDALAAAVAADPTRPLITFYDDATGERAELSGATLANWIAKTANLLVDGCGLSPGDIAAVRLPAHWQTASVLLGAWAAGLAVSLGGTPDSAAQVAFVAADRVGEAPPSASDVFALGLAPMAMPMRPAPPPGTVDYVAEVRGHGDRFAPVTPVGPGDLAVTSSPGDPSGTPDRPGTHGPAGPGTHGPGPRTHGEVVGAAGERAAAAGITAGDRVLVDGDALPDARNWLLAPLVAGATIVLVRNVAADPGVTDRRIAAERVTRRWPD
ncbi:TIGR03089 family protein [Luedemannella helvata]|uniref:TIGR03089 family protein n=1 Tax=Luedemannella helvata TaxID=349315 RepID=A0ABN2K1G8_9ACTN